MNTLKEKGPEALFCSNSCAAYLVSALDAVGGFPIVLTGEDTIVASRLLSAGFLIKYVAESEVHHSHSSTLLNEFRRHFDAGYSRNIQFKEDLLSVGNDYKKGLFNGDTGLIVEQNGERTAFFKKADNQIKSFRYSDLPSHEPAFAITIHKSQGSEFDTVLIIIPDKFSPVVTRELLYTGVTRARKKVIIAGNHETIKNAIQVDVKRYSGIEDHMTDIDQTYIGEI